MNGGYLDNPHFCFLARTFHVSLAATTDMDVLPGVLGCSFDRLRTGSPCDVRLKLPAASCRESSKCKEVLPFYCSSLANPAASYGECARWSIFNTPADCRKGKESGIPFRDQSKAGSFPAQRDLRWAQVHELLATTTDMAVLPGVLGCRPLRRTVEAPCSKLQGIFEM